MTGSPVLDDVLVWVLASVRIVALFAAAPVFRHTAMPIRVRAALGMLVTLAMAPALPQQMPEGDLAGFFAWVVAEALVGLALGFALRLLFSAFELLGEFVSVQGGLGAASVVDPTSGVSSLALAIVYHTFALLVFLAIDGHHELLRAAAQSYERIPIGAGGPDSQAFLAVVQLGSGVFETAVRMAAPVTVAMLVANVAVGILGRAIPQLNLMMLQLPAHVMVTFVLLMLGAGAFMRTAAGRIVLFTEQSVGAVLGGG